MRIADFFGTLTKSIERILFPSDCTCILCGRERITDKFGICSECAGLLFSVDEDREKEIPDTYLDGISITGRYRNCFGDAIMRLKFSSEPYLADKLASLLEYETEWDADMVVCVPMHPWREYLRGYNQSDLLAARAAELWGIPYDKRALERIKLTETQVGKDRRTRQLLPIGTFRANGGKCRGRRIIVVDDVCTTGATLNECARVLKECGAIAVYGVVLAHG